MWDAETIKDYRIEISEEKKRVVDALIDKYCVPAKGIILIFDDNGYGKLKFPTVWKSNRAMHINVKDYGISSWCPQYVESIVNTSLFSNIVWISKNVCISEEIEFVWTLAHELRHLQVDLKCSLITGIGCFLYNILGTIAIDEPKIPASIPTELDADLMSLRILLSMYSEKRIDEFIDYQINFGKHAENFRMLSEYNLSQNYNVFLETINMLRKYESQLKKIDKKFTKHIAYTFEDVYMELSKYV